MASPSNDHPTTTTMHRDKLLVQQGYDRMAQDYTSWNTDTSPSRKLYLDLALDLLAADITASPPQSNQQSGEDRKASVLEIACGAGLPVLQHLSRQHHLIDRLVANDFSSAQLALARQNCPKVEFHAGDMTKLDFEAGSFDLIVAFFAVFHLPRVEQGPMLRRIRRWLKSGRSSDGTCVGRDGGIAVFNLATREGEAIRARFHGAEMFWSSFGVEGNLAMVRDAGLEIVQSEVRASNPDAEVGDPDYGVQFLWIIARKREEEGLGSVG